MIAVARQRIETADYRATGRLVQVDASGKRISNSIIIKARWFPGVLRTLVQIVPPRSAAENAHPEDRVSILLETRPDGRDSIHIFRPHQSAPASLPFAEWSESILGTDFSYDDFLQPEYFWQSQTIPKSVKFGARDCDVLKSTPGAADHTHYAEVETWLDHTIRFPIYAEKTLKAGGIVKEFTYLGLTRSGGVWAARQVEAKIRGRAGSTLLIIERGSTRANLSSKDFSLAQIIQFEDRR
ncbi:MAG TPA: outer membrane lipoprotein-sorting protein [Terracidiphilus sp.]|nr:outer membrane lipoprotein-sorting protein [Terracidiphilus sp.]